VHWRVASQLSDMRAADWPVSIYRSRNAIPTYVLALKFDEPIELAKGKPLRTLRDAGEYVTALPKAD
jgi:hypothetical protein